MTPSKRADEQTPLVGHAGSHHRPRWVWLALAAAFVATLPGTVATAQNTAAARSDELAPENLDLYNASPLMRAIADVDSEQVRDFLI